MNLTQRIKEFYGQKIVRVALRLVLGIEGVIGYEIVHHKDNDSLHLRVKCLAGTNFDQIHTFLGEIPSQVIETSPAIISG